MLRAVPAMIFIAASGDPALRSSFFVSAISNNFGLTSRANSAWVGRWASGPARSASGEMGSVDPARW